MESPEKKTEEPVETGQQVGAARKKAIVYLVLAGIGFAVMVPLVIWGISVGHSGSAGKADGTPAVGRVDRSEPGNCFVGFEGSTCLLLHFTVFPEGEESFEARVEVNVEDHLRSKVRPGSYVRVIRDRQNRSKIYLDTEGLHNPPPTPPAADAQPPAP